LVCEPIHVCPEELVVEEAVIVSAVRTPVGTFGGQFKDVPATELGARAVSAALQCAGVSPKGVDEVVLVQLGDVDLFELNESFAGQSLAVIKELGSRPSGSTRTAGDRARAPDRGQRRPDPGDAAARDEAHAGRARARHPLRRGGQGQAAVIRTAANGAG
jgi:hypothetical protein